MFLDAKVPFSSAGPANDSDMASPASHAAQDQQGLEDVPFPIAQEDTIDGLTTESDDVLTNDEISDVRRMRSVHNTAGYRDGIGSSKEAHVQAGFDEGYSLGAEIGSKVGWILGVLDNLEKASYSMDESTFTRSGASKNDIVQLHSEAKADLSAQNIYSNDFFQGDGVWSFSLPSASKESSDEDITFRKVADAHPLIMTWNKNLAQLSSILGIDLEHSHYLARG
ncbi:hypothetical protein EJ08DRAFT_104496 [Tothia fuscella]|uniref:Protein YAE1 n=1 Tax=Tothia fuscella TaxID=1048955 RepID=A0A9P4U1K4_9PEZI|nr:hypothetical protein EJ08DRAFT_104496 [Tothia fuscella]